MDKNTMLCTNLLTINIQDKADKSAICIDLSNDTMYKLYRINEIKKYDTLYAYHEYNKFCDEIKESIQKFNKAINDDYMHLIAEIEQKEQSDESSNVIKHMDLLISNGCDYKSAKELINKQYFKKQD